MNIHTINKICWRCEHYKNNNLEICLKCTNFYVNKPEDLENLFRKDK